MKFADKAFEVDEHMRAAGVEPEEAELEALLKLSVEMGLEEKVYSLLHRLHTTVREFSASTVGVVEQWFTSSAAENAGKSRRRGWIWRKRACPAQRCVKSPSCRCSHKVSTL
jgi:proteinaceous RNase P